MEERLQLAVFIDFDNIEIGVKTTLNSELDIALVLDALKERGEVVSKSAYGDWARAGMQSRTMTEHAVHMVQRNVTPRGDKNGADINLVVDALEMAFTRPHINGFAIVGGDSDFIALVEKLKQFGKRVFVVGGRSFTSGILQRNCHEFIAYENLLGARSRGDKPQRSAAGGRLSLEHGFAQVQRALKILADRGVEPQLGPLKSTLLQLDSTFSERDYGASSFREFIQRLADKHHLNLKRIDHGYVVELNGEGGTQKPRKGDAEEGVEAPVAAEPEASGAEGDGASAPPTVATRPQEEALVLLRTALEKLNESRAGKPMYVRHLAQGLRAVDPEFDEQMFGFRTLTELMHVGQREGLLRMQRDRQGAWRITPVTATSADGGEGADAEASAAARAEAAESGAETTPALEPVVDPDAADAQDEAVSHTAPHGDPLADAADETADERDAAERAEAQDAGDDESAAEDAVTESAAAEAEGSAAAEASQADDAEAEAAAAKPATRSRRRTSSSTSGTRTSRTTRAKTTPRTTKSRSTSSSRRKSKDTASDAASE
ncbi:MAG TPA: NYN domain-containing protein [Candidatus Binatia bacterium]